MSETTTRTIQITEWAELQVKARFFDQFKKTPVDADMINKLAAYYMDAHMKLEAIRKGAKE